MDKRNLTQIEGKQKFEIVDNENSIITNHWEKRIEEVGIRLIDIESSVIDSIRNAKESIIIYTSKLTHPEINILFEELVEKGVRIYSITSNVTHHQDIFKHGVMREKNEIKSTFILIDPQSNQRIGYYLFQDLTSNIKPSLAYFKLTTKQIQEARIQFIYYFWNSSGNELFYGKIKDAKPLKPNNPKAPSSTKYVMHAESLQSLFSDNIEELWLSEYINLNLVSLQTDVKRLVLNLKEETKDQIYLSTFEEKEILGTVDLPFNFISRENSWIILLDDLALNLVEEQKQQIVEIKNSFEWEFSTSNRIADVIRDVIVFDSNWDAKTVQSIEELKVVDLGQVNAEKIEDWVKDQPKPILPDALLLARKIKYIWNLSPPTLPNNASRHVLYDSWVSFNQKLENKQKRILTIIEDILSSEEQFKKTKRLFISIKTKWLGWKPEIELKNVVKWDMADNNLDLEEYVEFLENCELEIKSDVEQLRNNIIGKKTTSSNAPNELEELQKNRKDKKSKRLLTNNELEEIISIPKDRKKIKDTIPIQTLPEIGILYETKKPSRFFLAVKAVEEIERALKLSKKYKATVVVNM